MRVQTKYAKIGVRFLAVVCLCLLPAAGALAQGKVLAVQGQPLIQLAVLLDTSNSMDGLISQAKSQLWKIVNEFARAKRQGQRPRLEVALYEYGNDGLPASEGHIRQVVPFTTDLDRISEQLFALRTNGGNEFCGQVIDRATVQLTWSPDARTLKLISIAGNEPFTQGSVDYRQAVRAAIGRGIQINTIFCGNAQEGIATKWQDGALLADGSYAAIDSNSQVAHVAAPQDQEIARLGDELNRTYIAYGGEGRKMVERQRKQDENAASVAQGAGIQRAVAKASGQYRNESWDLVDGESAGAVKVEKLADDALPEVMRKMSPTERKDYVAKMAAQRTEIQKKIQHLNDQRRQYVEAEQKKQAAQGGNTFDAAVIKSIRSQAAKKAFSFE